jgi:hypothetical protein
MEAGTETSKYVFVYHDENKNEIMNTGKKLLENVKLCRLWK